MPKASFERRGTHTTLIGLAKTVARCVSRNIKGAKISPGVISRGIGARTQKITICATETNTVGIKIVSNDTRQDIRIYDCNPNDVRAVLQKNLNPSVIIQIC